MNETNEANGTNETNERAIKEYLEWLHPDGGLINIASKNPNKANEKNKSEFIGMTANSTDAAISQAIQYANDGATTVWCSIQRMGQTAPKGKAKLINMTGYQYLAIDVDRDKTLESSCCVDDSEHHATLVIAKSIMERFANVLPLPLLLSTGNGHLLLYPIELLENTPENRTRMECLGKAIASVFGDSIDTGVTGDISRILGVAGTVNRGRVERADLGRLARMRRVVGDFPTRSPMDRAEFIAWADDYIEASGIAIPKQPTMKAAGVAMIPESQNGKPNRDVIGEFNRRLPIEDVLTRFGYIDEGNGRFTRPGGTWGGIHILDGKAFCHSTSDDLYDSDHAHSPFFGFLHQTAWR